MDNNPDERFNLNVKRLDGTVNTVEVSSSMTILQVKEILQQETEVHPDRQRLIFQGRVMADQSTVGDYNCTSGCSIHMVERVVPAESAGATSAGTQPQQQQHQSASIGETVGNLVSSMLNSTMTAHAANPAAAATQMTNNPPTPGEACNHVMELNDLSAFNLQWICNRCNTSGRGEVMECTTCNYHLCSRCYAVERHHHVVRVDNPPRRIPGLRFSVHPNRATASVRDNSRGPATSGGQPTGHRIRIHAQPRNSRAQTQPSRTNSTNTSAQYHAPQAQHHHPRHHHHQPHHQQQQQQMPRHHHHNHVHHHPHPPNPHGVHHHPHHHMHQQSPFPQPGIPSQQPTFSRSQVYVNGQLVSDNSSGSTSNGPIHPSTSNGNAWSQYTPPMHFTMVNGQPVPTTTPIDAFTPPFPVPGLTSVDGQSPFVATPEQLHPPSTTVRVTTTQTTTTTDYEPPQPLGTQRSPAALEELERTVQSISRPSSYVPSYTDVVPQGGAVGPQQTRSLMRLHQIIGEIQPFLLQLALAPSSDNDNLTDLLRQRVSSALQSLGTAATALSGELDTGGEPGQGHAAASTESYPGTGNRQQATGAPVVTVEAERAVTSNTTVSSATTTTTTTATSVPDDVSSAQSPVDTATSSTVPAADSLHTAPGASSRSEQPPQPPAVNPAASQGAAQPSNSTEQPTAQASAPSRSSSTSSATADVPTPPTPNTSINNTAGISMGEFDLSNLSNMVSGMDLASISVFPTPPGQGPEFAQNAMQGLISQLSSNTAPLDATRVHDMVRETFSRAVQGQGVGQTVSVPSSSAGSQGEEEEDQTDNNQNTPSP